MCGRFPRAQKAQAQVRRSGRHGAAHARTLYLRGWSLAFKNLSYSI